MKSNWEIRRRIYESKINLKVKLTRLYVGTNIENVLYTHLTDPILKIIWPIRDLEQTL